MPINLPDLRTAVAAAVDGIIVTVSAAVPDVPATINPNEEFTYSVTASNTAANTIRFVNVAYHLSVAPGTVGQLKVPASPPARAINDPTAPVLAVGSFQSAMFLFPTDNSLDVNDTDTISGLKGKGLGLGAGTISAHLHVDPDLDFLFPKGEVGINGTRVFNVV
jgi:hypothetical protein